MKSTSEDMQKKFPVVWADFVNIDEDMIDFIIMNVEFMQSKGEGCALFACNRKGKTPKYYLTRSCRPDEMFGLKSGEIEKLLTPYEYFSKLLNKSVFLFKFTKDMKNNRRKINEVVR